MENSVKMLRSSGKSRGRNCFYSFCDMEVMASLIRVVWMGDWGRGQKGTSQCWTPDELPEMSLGQLCWQMCSKDSDDGCSWVKGNPNKDETESKFISQWE